jgi:hypothetical protein
MTYTAPFSHLPSEFNAFLFESIGEESNGMLLSVLSALARMDVDPWQEASHLARLPRNTATKRLASMIAAIPSRLSAPSDHEAIAGRLIALLPDRASSKIVSPETRPGISAPTKSAAFIYVLFFLMAVMAGAQFMATSRQAPEQVDDAHAAPSRAVSTQMPLPTLGQ